MKWQNKKTTYHKNNGLKHVLGFVLLKIILCTISRSHQRNPMTYFKYLWFYQNCPRNRFGINPRLAHILHLKTSKIILKCKHLQLRWYFKIVLTY